MMKIGAAEVGVIHEVGRSWIQVADIHTAYSKDLLPGTDGTDLSTGIQYTCTTVYRCMYTTTTHAWCVIRDTWYVIQVPEVQVHM
jgi:hypothetical protein